MLHHVDAAMQNTHISCVHVFPSVYVRKTCDRILCACMFVCVYVVFERCRQSHTHTHVTRDATQPDTTWPGFGYVGKFAVQFRLRPVAVACRCVVRASASVKRTVGEVGVCKCDCACDFLRCVCVCVFSMKTVSVFFLYFSYTLVRLSGHKKE